MRGSGKGGWLFAVAFHALGLASLLRGIKFSEDFPILTGDYSLYFARVLRARSFLESSDRAWGYDPFTMAGFPSGPIHELGSRFLTLIGTPLVAMAGSSLPLTFVEILLLASFPFGAAAFVRMMGCDFRTTVRAFVLTTAFYGTFGIVSARLMAHGFLPYQAGLFLSLVAVGSFHRLINEGGRRWLALFSAAVLLVPQVHPAAALSLLIPLSVLYISRFRALPRLVHASCAVIAVLAVATNGPWIRDYLAFRDWSEAVTGERIFTLSSVWRELGFRQTTLTGVWMSCVTFYLLIFGFLGWREILKRSRPMGLALAAWIVFSVVAPWAFSVSVPWRFYLVIEILACCLAAIGMQPKGELPRWFPGAVVSLAVFAALTRWSFDHDGGRRRLVNTFPADQKSVIGYLEKNASRPGRFLIECESGGSGNKPHYLDLAHELTGAHVLGGSNAGNFMKRFTIFSGMYVADGEEQPGFHPNVFGRRLDQISETELDAMLTRYNVHEILTHTRSAKESMKRFTSIIASTASVGSHSLWRVRRPSTWFIEGSGDLSASYDRLVIRNPSRGRIILSFHWIKTLAAGEIPIKPALLPGSPIPFIEIDNRSGAAEISIVNAGL